MAYNPLMAIPPVIRVEKIEEKLNNLCQMLTVLSANYIDRTQAHRELVENEWIHEDMFKKSLENDLRGIIMEIQDYIDFYRGMM